MRTEGSIEIDAPINDVFRLTTEDVKWWSKIVVEDEVIESHPDVVGTNFRSVTEHNGQKMTFDGIVTRNEPPLVHAVEMNGQQFNMEVAYMFEQLAPEQTRVTQISDVHGKGIFRILIFFAGSLMAKASCDELQIELRNLKDYCEHKYENTQGEAGSD